MTGSRNVKQPFFFRQSSKFTRSRDMGVFTAFVDRLNKRIPKSALWELFSHYGSLVDVFIPYRLYRSSRKTVYGFVRFKFEADMMRVIKEWNNKKVDGFCLVVKRARVGKVNNSRLNSDEKEPYRKMGGRGKPWKERDHRTFRDVVLGIPADHNNKEDVMGQNQHVVISSKVDCPWGGSITAKSGIIENDRGVVEAGDLGKDPAFDDLVKAQDKVIVEGKTSHLDEVDESLRSSMSFSVCIQESEIEWLNSCAIRMVKDGVDLPSIKAGIENTGFQCHVCPMGGISVLLRFESEVSMRSFLKDPLFVRDQWFETVQQWGKTTVQRKTPIWIALEDVPLQLWDLKFFKALGDLWGSFVKLDYATENKRRFDKAKMLVIVDSKLCIPSVVSVKFGGSIL
ncbi:hypothetical protein PTKIN_Ptkin10aG0170300 [Pterospermum kingtungense]